MSNLVVTPMLTVTPKMRIVIRKLRLNLRLRS